MHSDDLVNSGDIIGRLQGYHLITEKDKIVEEFDLFKSIITEYCPVSDNFINLLLFGEELDGKDGEELVNEINLDRISMGIAVMKEIMDSKYWQTIVNLDLLLTRMAAILRNYFKSIAEKSCGKISKKNLAWATNIELEGKIRKVDTLNTYEENEEIEEIYYTDRLNDRMSESYLINLADLLSRDEYDSDIEKCLIDNKRIIEDLIFNKS